MPIGMNHETENINAHQDVVLQTGSIFGNARSSAPSGYLLCDGSAVNRATYARLFTAIGTTYGAGDGSTTFNIPDLRGGVPRGAGTSSGYTQNVTVTLGTKDNDFVLDHSHIINIPQGHGYSIGGSGGYGAFQTYGALSGLFGAGLSVGGMNSGRWDNETRMKNLGVNFFIKF